MAIIVHQISIEATPARVFSLVSAADGFAEWWAEDVSAAADGSVDLGFFNRATVYRLRPQTQLAASHAVWICETGKDWAGTQLSFDLAPAKSGTTLRFRHANWKEVSDYFVSCNTTWGGLLFRLKAAAEGRRPGPLFLKGSMAH